jgi:predicted nucleic acid-binding protein
VTGFVLDTSVAIAWYLPEVFAARARAFREKLIHGRVRLVVPGLHYWEFANVLRTYVRRSELDGATAREIFDVHLGAPLERAEPDPASVLELALRYDATAYDAVYVALAESLDLRLLTAEKTTTPWVSRLGKRIENVRR